MKTLALFKIPWNIALGILLIISGMMTNEYTAPLLNEALGEASIIQGIQVSQDMPLILSFGLIIAGIIVFFSIGRKKG